MKQTVNRARLRAPYSYSGAYSARMRTRLLAMFAVAHCVCAVLCMPLAHADPSGETPFLPTWKLLNNQEKRHFIAGYLQGWRDAAKITEIVINFLEENPADPVASLKRLRALYDLPNANPDTLTVRIDDFFSKTENGAATLSQAITAAQQEPKTGRTLPK